MIEHPSDLEVFVRELHERLEPSNKDQSVFKEDRFAQLVIDTLVRAGELDGGTPSFYSKREMKVNGYNLDLSSQIISLFVCAVSEPEEGISEMDESALEIEFLKVVKFFENSLQGLHERIETTSPAFNLSRIIFQEKSNIEFVQFLLFLDGFVDSTATRIGLVSGFDCSFRAIGLKELFEFKDVVKPYAKPKRMTFSEAIIPLRDNVNIVLRLPDDLTKVEAEELARIVLSLHSQN